jgi:hypothetical protein
MAEACDQYVYITSGLSQHSMPTPEGLPYKPVANVELMAVCEGQINGGESGDEDVASYLLQMVSQYIVDEKMFVEPGHALDFQDPFFPNSEMSAFLCVVPEGMDEKRICKGTPAAKAILSLVPISANELKLCREEGVERLIDVFEEKNVMPIFDPFRSSAL